MRGERNKHRRGAHDKRSSYALDSTVLHISCLVSLLCAACGLQGQTSRDSMRSPGEYIGKASAIYLDFGLDARGAESCGAGHQVPGHTVNTSFGLKDPGYPKRPPRSFDSNTADAKAFAKVSHAPDAGRTPSDQSWLLV